MAVHMAVSDVDVSNSVYNLIHAFTDGQNVFKRLRARRSKKSKNKQAGPKDVGASDAELQLSSSLRRGPVELGDKYARCYGEKGEVFARGDSIAHASLAETLFKLNTGLVTIIATFLNHDSKTNTVHLDYKSLTNLSDTSRREAINSLNQLYYRLSHSQPHLKQLTPIPQPSSHPEKRRRSGSRQRLTVTRASVKNSNQTQLVMVRPKNVKRGSTSSSSGSSPPTKALLPQPTPVVNLPYAFPEPSSTPLPQYSPKDPFPVKKPQPTAKTNGTRGRKRADSSSHDKQYPPTSSPHGHKTKQANNSSATPASAPQLREKKSLPMLLPSLSSPYPAPSQPIAPAVASAIPSHIKRRIDKPTPSTYTFLSESTKLGEIPQRKWTTPWDPEEAERLNAVAAAKGVVITAGAAGRQRKKGLFGFLRRGSEGARVIG